jgi:hypothetical protein
MNEGKLVLRHTPLGVIPHLREHLLHVGEAKLVCRISIGFFAGERCRDNALSILGWNFLGWSGVDLGLDRGGKRRMMLALKIVVCWTALSCTLGPCINLLFCHRLRRYPKLPTMG